MCGHDEASTGGATAPMTDITTRDGLALHVREAKPADSDALVALFQHVSPEDLRFRFQETVKQIDATWLARLLEGGRTFVAFDDSGEAVACCLLVDGPDDATADVNLAVDPIERVEA